MNTIYSRPPSSASLTPDTTADEARNIAELIEQADKLARDLLTIQGGDDPDEALPGALHFLMRAANVADDFQGLQLSRPQYVGNIVLRVLVAKFGVESVRDWTRDFARRPRRRRRQ